MNLFSDLLSSENSKIPINNGPVIKQRRGVEIKSSREIEIMRKSSKIVATVLSEIRDLVKPGMSTLGRDNLRTFFDDHSEANSCIDSNLWIAS